MPIKKQEFYEGAALHMLARTGMVNGLSYNPPFFLINNRLSVLLKYAARGRSPWSFTFMPDEQILLQKRASETPTVIGLVCGADGVAAFSYEAYVRVAPIKATALHIACYRDHGEHYEVNGPEGKLPRKVALSDWQRILAEERDSL